MSGSGGSGINKGYSLSNKYSSSSKDYSLSGIYSSGTKSSSRDDASSGSKRVAVGGRVYARHMTYSGLSQQSMR